MDNDAKILIINKRVESDVLTHHHGRKTVLPRRSAFENGTKKIQQQQMRTTQQPQRDTQGRRGNIAVTTQLTQRERTKAQRRRKTVINQTTIMRRLQNNQTGITQE